MSEHLTPLYLDQAINVFHASGDELDDEDSDELNGFEPVGSKPQPELDSDEFEFQAKVDYLTSQALAAKELQDICLAVNELICWRLMEDIAAEQSYVFLSHLIKMRANVEE